MEKKKRGITKWLYWFTFAVAVIIVYKTLDSFNDIKIWIDNLFKLLMPFILGILLAYILYLPSTKIEKKYKKSKSKFILKRARAFSVITTYIIAILLLIIIINFVLPTITKSVVDLVNNVPTFYKNAINYVETLPDDNILNKINAKGILENINNFDFKQFINIGVITEYAKGIIEFASGVFSIFVTFIVSIYILIERNQILEFISNLISAIFKENTAKNISRYFGKTNQIFFKFIYSQVLDGIVVGILTGIGMSILGVKYALLLGIMIGIFNIIPYFGAIIAVSIAIIITIFTGGFAQAVWMAIIVIVLQQIDANIINPKIVSNSLKLSPILVILAVTIGGAYFGVLGMFLAVPIIAVIKILIMDYIQYKNKIKKEE